MKLLVLALATGVVMLALWALLRRTQLRLADRVAQLETDLPSPVGHIANTILERLAKDGARRATLSFQPRSAQHGDRTVVALDDRELTVIPGFAHEPLVEHFRRRAQLDPRERNAADSGAFTLLHHNHQYRLLATFLPGETLADITLEVTAREPSDDRSSS